MRNPVLDTNATTVEGILFWSYGISNGSGVKALDYYPETRGRIGSRIEDLRVEAAMVQRIVNQSLTWPHLRAIIEAKYGERRSSIAGCAVILKKTSKTNQSVDNLTKLVEHFCLIRKYRDREASIDFNMGSRRYRETRSWYEGILEGWTGLALDILDESFKEKGWI